VYDRRGYDHVIADRGRREGMVKGLTQRSSMGIEVRVAKVLGLVFPKEGNVTEGLDAGA
jgi:hypothetical protein